MNETESKFKGLWWLPETSAERWVGVLACRKGRSLSLKFTVPEGYCKRVPETPVVIHGVNSNNQPITLLFPGRTQCSQSAAFTTYEFTAGYAVRGFHLENAAVLKLHQALIRLEYLHDWVGRTGFDRKPRKARDWNIRYKLPKDLTFSLRPDLKVEIMTQARSRQGGRGYEIEETTGLRLRFKTGAGLKEVTDWVNSLRGLLHFSILKPVHLIKLGGRKNRYGRSYGDLYLPHDIEIVLGMNRREAVERYTHVTEFIFTFADLQADFSGFMQRWVDYEERYEKALGCYYTTVYHSQVNSEEFLSLTRALDAYWGIKNAQRDDNDFPKKIRELVTTHHAHIAKWVPDIAAFVDGVKVTRHYHTHYGAKWEASGKVIDGADLDRLNVVLRILFQACVLSDLGIPADRFKRLHRQYPVCIVEYKA